MDFAKQVVAVADEVFVKVRFFIFRKLLARYLDLRKLLKWKSQTIGKRI